MTRQEVIDTIVEALSGSNPDDLETDNEGQILVHTGIYRHADGSYNLNQENA